MGLPIGITLEKVIQDNKIGEVDLMAIHSLLNYIATGSFIAADSVSPDRIGVRIKSSSGAELADYYARKIKEYLRRYIDDPEFTLNAHYLFQADKALRALMNRRYDTEPVTQANGWFMPDVFQLEGILNLCSSLELNGYDESLAYWSSTQDGSDSTKAKAYVNSPAADSFDKDIAMLVIPCRRYRAGDEEIKSVSTGDWGQMGIIFGIDGEGYILEFLPPNFFFYSKWGDKTKEITGLLENDGSSHIGYINSHTIAKQDPYSAAYWCVNYATTTPQVTDWYLGSLGDYSTAFLEIEPIIYSYITKVWTSSQNDTTTAKSLTSIASVNNTQKETILEVIPLRYYKSYEVKSLGDRSYGGGYVYEANSLGSGLYEYYEIGGEQHKTSKEWGDVTTDISGTSELAHSGLTNTGIIIAAQGDDEDYAAQYCYNLNSNVWRIVASDWFLPSYYELVEMYALKALGYGSFGDAMYWSSTEVSADTAQQFDFATGSSPAPADKNRPTRFRPCRSFISENSYDIGDFGQHGLVFYKAGNYYLEAAPVEAEDTLAWGTMATTTGATGNAIGTGRDNTELIVAIETGKAANACVEYGGIREEYANAVAKLSYVAEMVRDFEIEFYWTNEGSSEQTVSTTLTAYQAARQVGETECLTDIYNNEARKFYAFKNRIYYLYFYVAEAPRELHACGTNVLLPQVGLYRFDEIATVSKTVVLQNDLGEAIASQDVEVLPNCETGLFVKFLENSTGFYKHWLFERFYSSSDNHEAIGTVERIAENLREAGFLSIGKKSVKKIIATASGLDQSKLDYLADLWKSKDVFVEINSKWVRVEIEDGETPTRWGKANSGSITLTFKFPESNTINLL